MILITGSSGHLSALIIDKATVAGLAPIAAGRNPGPIGASQRRMDFDDPASLDFSGVQTLLLVSAGYAEDDVVMARHDNVIAAA